jgi:hypothetical protein
MDVVKQRDSDASAGRSFVASTARTVAIVIISLCAVAIVSAVALFVAVGVAAGNFGHHAKDPELMRTFAEHKATFERLVAMSDSDSDFVRIAPTFTQPEMSSDRWNAYRAVFDTLHLSLGLSRYAARDTLSSVFMRGVKASSSPGRARDMYSPTCRSSHWQQTSMIAQRSLHRTAT